MIRVRRWLLGACLLLQAAVAHAQVSGLSYVSVGNEGLGQGLSETLEAPAVPMSAVMVNGSLTVRVGPDSSPWVFRLRAPFYGPIVPGDYAGTANHVLTSPARPFMDISKYPRSCGTGDGWFRVRELSVAGDGQVQSLAIDFMNRCLPRQSPLVGSIRYQSSIGFSVPTFMAMAGRDFGVIEGDTVFLDAGQSFSATPGDSLRYRWKQTDGPPVTLDYPRMAAPSFAAPAVALEGSTLRFQLQVTNAAGVTVSDDVIVRVDSEGAARTEVRLWGDGRDYVTEGVRYRFNRENANLQFKLMRGAYGVFIWGDTMWDLYVAPPAGATLGKGRYLNAERYLVQSPDRPGLDLSGDGRGCNKLTGEFTVHQWHLNANGDPRRVEISFEQHCGDAAPAAYGRVLRNAVPHELVAKRLQEARLIWPRGSQR